jgi:DNA-binding HxlR family transcriptional regulator
MGSRAPSLAEAAMSEFDRSRCPIAVTLDVLGDRWSLVVVRDMLVGKSRFGEFLASPEGIPTNILAGRLRRLETQGIVARRAYETRPMRYDYTLTAKGRGLLPVLQAMARWASGHVPGTWTPSEEFMRREVE